MNPDLMLTPFIRINSQWIMDLHVEHMTIKILGKKKKENPWYLRPDLTPKAQPIKGKLISELDSNLKRLESP